MRVNTSVNFCSALATRSSTENSFGTRDFNIDVRFKLLVKVIALLAFMKRLRAIVLEAFFDATVLERLVLGDKGDDCPGLSSLPLSELLGEPSISDSREVPSEDSGRAVPPIVSFLLEAEEGGDGVSCSLPDSTPLVSRAFRSEAALLSCDEHSESDKRLHWGRQKHFHSRQRSYKIGNTRDARRLLPYISPQLTSRGPTLSPVTALSFSSWFETTSWSSLGWEISKVILSPAWSTSSSSANLAGCLKSPLSDLVPRLTFGDKGRDFLGRLLGALSWRELY